MFLLLVRLPPTSPPADTLCPYTTLCRPLAGLGVIRRHLAADRSHIRAAMANDHLAVEHPRRARDEPNIVLAHRHLRPERLAGLCVDRDQTPVLRTGVDLAVPPGDPAAAPRSEEHTSELQSLMRISYAVFCLKKKKITKNRN